MFHPLSRISATDAFIAHRHYDARYIIFASCSSMATRFAYSLSTLINILLCEMEARWYSVEKSDDARYYNTIERCSFFDNKARKIIIKLPLITQLPNPSTHVSIHNLCLLILSNSWNHHFTDDASLRF